MRTPPLKEEEGSELLEGALVSVMVFGLIIGTVWLGRGYNIYATITRAAREGARYAAAPSCATCGNAYPTNSAIQDVVNQVLQASSLPAPQVTPCSDSPTAPCITITPNPMAAYNPASPNPVTIKIVYPTQLTIPFLPLQAGSISISSTVQVRQE